MSTPASQARLGPVVGPRLRVLLRVVLVLFGLLAVNSLYLGSVTALEAWLGYSLENTFYLGMFLAHLALGLAIILPVLVYGVLHARKGIGRPNRRAVWAGIATFVLALLLLVTGLMLTRDVPLLELRDPDGRRIAYWLHVVAPLLVVWMFVLHRLVGPRLRWRAGVRWAVAAVGFTVIAVAPLLQAPGAPCPPARPVAKASLLSLSLPALFPVPGGDHCAVVPDAQRRFAPGLVQTVDGELIDSAKLMNDEYCKDCHADTHAAWSVSAHRHASFDNPAYRFSVRNTKAKAIAQYNDPKAAQWCAGCHDPVPLLSGALDDPNYDDVRDPTAHAGITCSVCHGIVGIGSVRGNADFIIQASPQYPFAESEQPFLRWVNQLLIKSKPEFHRRTFLKPFHKTAEFCSTCHKVHLPPALNHYKWLRGQNHYDGFLLSGVSGHGLQSFYYPKQAAPNCAKCHMPLTPSNEFGARPSPEDGQLTLHDHQFPAANTALASFFGLPDSVNEAHRKLLKKALRVDIFALHEGDSIESPPIAPLSGNVVLKPGATYVLDVVLRTVGVGHPLTEGTIDSNELWVALEGRSGDRVIARSGGLVDAGRTVDPRSHFLNAYVIDREGRRIDRRNAEDIFTRLYDHQIPPGAGEVVHYRFRVPPDARGPLTLAVQVNYRKFDTNYVRLFREDPQAVNDLPIVDMASDSITLEVAGTPAPSSTAAAGAAPRAIAAVPLWERWNDYGIGFLRKPNRGALRQAEAAFRRVEAMGKGAGALNLARVYLAEGRVADAAAALARVRRDDTVPPWSLAYFTALVDIENANYDAAIRGLEGLLNTQMDSARARGFDFSKDYRARNQLAGAYFDRGRQRPDRDAAAADFAAAITHFKAALAVDPENAAAHYGLSQVYTRVGDSAQAARHVALHARYRVDDNARDRAVALARARDPAVNHAAEAVVIYDAAAGVPSAATAGRM